MSNDNFFDLDKMREHFAANIAVLKCPSSNLTQLKAAVAAIATIEADIEHLIGTIDILSRRSIPLTTKVPFAPLSKHPTPLESPKE